MAKRCRDPRQFRRLLALAAAYDGMSRREAAKVGGMDRQTLRDLAHRFNEDGPDGLTNRVGAGRPRLLSDEQMRELSLIVETGPDPVVDGVVRWRRIDLNRVIEERFGVTYSERALSDLLAALSFSLRRACRARFSGTTVSRDWKEFEIHFRPPAYGGNAIDERDTDINGKFQACRINVIDEYYPAAIFYNMRRHAAATVTFYLPGIIVLPAPRRLQGRDQVF